MSTPERDDGEALRRALAALRDLKGRLDRAERAAHEPIAIIGAGCRLPGGINSPEGFWDLLHDRRDAVGRIPAGRWNHDEYFDPDGSRPGSIYTDQGGFVDWPVDQFDADFFGIAPREANDLDPQQRLLLEVTWEAFEHAGIAPDRMAGSSTGVFIGLGTTDYANLTIRSDDPANVGAYFGTGVAPAVASGRISHTLGLRGTGDDDRHGVLVVTCRHSTRRPKPAVRCVHDRHRGRRQPDARASGDGVPQPIPRPVSNRALPHVQR